MTIIQSVDRLLELEGQMVAKPGSVERATWLSAADDILDEADSDVVRRAGVVAIRICQTLYGQARSLDALPIALSVFQRANDICDDKLTHLSAVASGLLSSDTADFAGAIEFHAKALELMKEFRDQSGASRSWNNIGSALCGVGRYELASASFRRALDQVTALNGPQHGRYSALTNLAQCALHTGQIDSGLESAALALNELELGRSSFHIDSFSELLLRRNMVRLFVAKGDLGSAQHQVGLAKVLAKQDGGIRTSIAVATAQAVIDIAHGQFDIAATRLERCLAASRSMRPALRDTLACMVRADEAVGNSARALVRLQELSELMHDSCTKAAQAHLALSDWRQSMPAFGAPNEITQTRDRLVQSRAAASIPSAWPTLTRLALGNALQIDPSAAHGTRVGALSRMLAQAYGLGPIEALEIGLASQVHDLGIAADQENLLGRIGGASAGPAAEEDHGHCETGWRILCEDDHPRILLAREIAKYHHAWVNGEGHPGGLVGRSIPLHARICAVADAYDNIMHWEKPGGMDTIARGLARLKTFSGTRLEPELVELFADALEDETRNEGIELESGHGLTTFHQLINSLSRTQR